MHALTRPAGAFLAALLSLLAPRFGAAADRPAGAPAAGASGNAKPAERLVGLCAAPAAPAAEKLREAYIEWQWQRLAGKAELPQPAPARSAGRRTPKVTGDRTPLSAEELEKLETWFKAQPEFRDRFLLALDPVDDVLPAAARVALRLREKFPKDSDALSNLLIAFAVVWDSPQVVQQSLTQAVPELHKQKPKLCAYEESFGWFVKHRDRLCPWFRETPWRLLVYLAVEGLTLDERDWALQRYGFSASLGMKYSDVAYDMSKLRDGAGRLGNNPYTLANLLTYGGVCRDQAYFARAVCRAFGLPAYMATGRANTGLGHAWVGWIVREAQGYKLLSHGRYASDKYFTANIIDPTSGRQILDYLVGIEARALSDEPGYDAADLCYRVWREVGAKLTPAQRVNLLTTALRTNAYHRAAWLAVGEATAAGELPRESADKQWQYLNAKFKQFPDFTFGMLQNFAKMFKTAADKYNFYEATAKLFYDLRRQDLVAKLRLEEIAMCETEQRKDLAGQVALAAMQECAGEGRQGAELAQKAVALMRELKQPQAAIQPLKQALVRTPRARMDFANPNWVVLTTLLRDLYTEIGDTRNAANLQAQLDRVMPAKK